MRGGVIDNTAKDAAVFGLEIPEPSEPDRFEVEPEAWQAVVGEEPHARFSVPGPSPQLAGERQNK